MLNRRSGTRRIPPQSKANWRRKCAIQLDFFAEISDNRGVKSETPVLKPLTPPNRSGGTSSTMISLNSTPTPTYPQDWKNYNLAQQNEKERFLVLLRDLCNTVPQPPQGRGRPRLPLADMLLASVFKTYSGFSSRRFTTDVQAVMRDGLIDSSPHFNSTNRYIADPDLTPLLKSLIEVSASPLGSVESDFAADSTGFATSTYARWYDHKWGKERKRQTWVKTHVMCGVKTNVVTAVEATSTESADSKQLPGLLERTARHFDITEVSADKAYSSRANLHAVVAVGATPYIPFVRTATGRTNTKNPRPDNLWSQAWHFYNFHQEEFAAHYHKRSNAETVMAMIKAKFGASVKSKTPTAQVNEVLCKVLAHNICVLIQSFYELGIESTFVPITKPEPKVIDLNQYRAQRGL